MAGKMKAIVANRLGEFSDVLNVDESHPKPSIKKETEILVRVHACSLSPGDFRRVRGDIKYVWSPKTPFIPGMNVCGTVVEAGARAKFHVGECVVASDDTFLGGLAEFKVLESAVCQVKPENMSTVEACTMPDSALRAFMLMESVGISGKERVLVIGASGGFGLFLIQFLKALGVPYLVAVSSQEKLLESLGVDRVIDYTTGEKYWEDECFKTEPFDVVFDCVGEDNWNIVKTSKILKPSKKGGVFMAVAMNDPTAQVHSAKEMVGLLGGFASKTAKSIISPSSPKYRQMLVDGKSNSFDLIRLFDYFQEKKMKVILDPPTPFPFTKEGAIEAFKLQESRHAHGKIVIQIDKDRRS